MSSSSLYQRHALLSVRAGGVAVLAAGYVEEAAVTSRRGAQHIRGRRYVLHGVAATHYTKVPPQTEGKFHVIMFTLHDGMKPMRYLRHFRVVLP